uniref:Uncharacterized protein n=1 Tax=Aegilops tauschii subsp. strangulata TaxID=200361 RepID=A0A453JCI5_AEGTS
MLTKAQWIALSKEKQGGSTSNSKKKGKGKQCSARKNFANSDAEDAPAPQRRKFDIRKVRCHKCGLLSHFKATVRKQQSNGCSCLRKDMMSMCKLLD